MNRAYLELDQLRVHRLSRGFAWLDAGTSTALQEASSYIQTIEKRQDVKIGCPEEAALMRGFLSISQFEALLQTMPECEYRAYLQRVAEDVRRQQSP